MKAIIVCWKIKMRQADMILSHGYSQLFLYYVFSSIILISSSFPLSVSMEMAAESGGFPCAVNSSLPDLSNGVPLPMVLTRQLFSPSS